MLGRVKRVLLRYRFYIILPVIPMIIPVYWGFYLEPASLHIEEYELRIPRWPEALNGFRIAVLSDIHTGSPHNDEDKLTRIIRETNEATPDMVLLTGDYVITGVLGGTFVAPELIAQQLSGLKAPVGVYSVLGNHDWWLDAERVQQALETAGIPALEDRSVKLDYREASFWLTGISDYWEGPHDITRALQDVTSDAPIIAFTHNPDVFPDIPAHVALTIAGHTHGGQVNFPLIGPLIVPSIHGRKYAEGHVVEQDRHLFVTPGLGTSILPVRFRVPPEISVLVLYSAG